MMGLILFRAKVEVFLDQVSANLISLCDSLCLNAKVILNLTVFVQYHLDQ